MNMRSGSLALIVVAAAASAWAGSPVREDAQFRCRVTPMRPYLGFDLRFHADYEVIVPFQSGAQSLQAA